MAEPDEPDIEAERLAQFHARARVTRSKMAQELRPRGSAFVRARTSCEEAGSAAAVARRNAESQECKRQKPAGEIDESRRSLVECKRQKPAGESSDAVARKRAEVAARVAKARAEQQHTAELYAAVAPLAKVEASLTLVRRGGSTEWVFAERADVVMMFT